MEPNMKPKKRLYRSRTDRMVAGVAGGMAEYFDVDPTLMRILWAGSLILGGFPGLFLYFACMAIIPEEPLSDDSSPKV